MLRVLCWALAAVAALAVAALMCINEVRGIVPALDRDPASLDRAIKLIRVALRRHPVTQARPQPVPVPNAIRASDSLLDWVGTAYPGTEVNNLAWYRAAVAFMDARDERGVAQEQLAGIIAAVPEQAHP